MTDAKASLPVSEALHRCVLLLIFLLTVSCLYLTYVGIDTYVESGRSVYGDARTATGYQWKKRSCDELFRGVFLSPVLPSVHDGSHELCEVARNGHVPPVALKSLIEELRSPQHDSDRPGMGRDAHTSQVLLSEVRARFVRRLPELRAHYRPHQCEVACMWLFFPGILGGLGSYFYARRYTPALFAVIKKRFENIMFGRNRYSDNFDNFIGGKKK
jgi:hypothetical protein